MCRAATTIHSNPPFYQGRYKHIVCILSSHPWINAWTNEGRASICPVRSDPWPLCGVFRVRCAQRPPAPGDQQAQINQTFQQHMGASEHDPPNMTTVSKASTLPTETPRPRKHNSRFPTWQLILQRQHPCTFDRDPDLIRSLSKPIRTMAKRDSMAWVVHSINRAWTEKHQWQTLCDL